MKCPNCGHWNRASFPRCFQCGCPLEPEKKQEQPAWRETMEHAAPAKVYIQVDEEGNQTSATDQRDQLAQEMKDLMARKERGEVHQRRLRQAGAERGIAPTGRNIQSMTGRDNLFTRVQRTSYVTDEVEGEVRPDAIPVTPKREVDYDDFSATGGFDATGRAKGRRADGGMTARQMRVTRRFGLSRVTRVLALCVLGAVLVFCGYEFVYKPIAKANQEAPLDERVQITASILNDMAAHTILIPAPEGSSIYIKELRKAYIVSGGYATVQVADYNWYEDEGGVTEEKVDVTLTPYIKTSAGEQKLMGEIHYTVDVPLSPLLLISPDVSYMEVNSDTYTVQFRVEKNSTVYINGEKYTDLVNTQDGLISFNANVQANGANEFKIVTRCQYYRENTVTLTLYRAPVAIEVRLDPTMNNRSIDKLMTVTGTTLAGANLVVLSPYQDLDLSQMASVGNFTFKAKFTTIGNNDIIIQVSVPGVEPTLYTRTIYYLPPASEYTRMAWPMYRNSDYIDFLSNVSTRVAKTQVYECIGEITEILSASPQLAIMETCEDGSGASRPVLLENKSTDTWEVGTRYRVYADAYGTYNSMPRLVGRYTYAPRK